MGQGRADGYFAPPSTRPDYLARGGPDAVRTDVEAFDSAEQDVKDKVEQLLAVNGQKTVLEFHRELGSIMWEQVGMSRNADGLKDAISKISALRGEGVAELLERIGAELSARVSGEGLVGHLRQRRALEDAAGALARAENALQGDEAETVAEDLRATFRALERLVGRIGAEDVLDTVFASFCLGK